jgi:hypothetical protein
LKTNYTSTLIFDVTILTIPASDRPISLALLNL